MDSQSFELTLEDILYLHRGWIANLYVQHRTTEAEIVDLLHERGLLVTLSQIQHFIRECDLIPSSMEHSGPSSPSPTLSDDSELVSTPTQSAHLASSEPSDPEQMREYNKKPLPSIPIVKAPSKSAKIQKRRPSSTTDRLGLTCVHGPNAADAHEVQTPLNSIPDGMPPIDRFAGDEQAHEKLALALASHCAPPVEQQESDEELILPLRWPRSTDTRRVKASSESKVSVRPPEKRMNGKPNGNRSSSNRKRKLEEREDKQDSKERKKMSPSLSPSASPSPSPSPPAVA